MTGIAAAGAANAAGIGMMLLGVMLFAFNDALGKWLVGSFAVGQLLLVRSVAGLLAMAPFIARTGPAAFLGAPRKGRQLWRVALSTAESALFFWALTHLPLASVITFYMAAPIWVTALSPWLLRERVGWRRRLAVLAGFGGVVLAVSPGADTLAGGALFAIVGSFTYALFLIATRQLAGTPGVVLMTWQLVAALLFGAALVAVQGWQAAGPLDLLLMALLGLGSLGGNLCVIKSLRLAPAAVVVPWQYTLILWGIALGWAVFGDVPGAHELAGAAVIVSAGLYILHRERVARRV